MPRLETFGTNSEEHAGAQNSSPDVAREGTVRTEPSGVQMSGRSGPSMQSLLLLTSSGFSASLSGVAWNRRERREKRAGAEFGAIFLLFSREEVKAMVAPLISL